MTIRTIVSIIICACFSLSIPAMEPLGNAGRPIVLKKRKASESSVIRESKKRRINCQKTNSAALHPKVNKNILKDGHLIAPKEWPQALKNRKVNQKFSRNDPSNTFGVSLIGGEDTCFALHPGKNILGQGQRGKVKLAQVLYLHPNGLSAHLLNPIKVGDWVAIKIQEEEFEESEIEGIFLTKNFLIASPFEYAAKDKSTRFACPLRLVAGNTLKEQLLKTDPEKKWKLHNFVNLVDSLNSALTRQIHVNVMSFNDKISENIIGETFIDFGNVLLFDSECRRFYQSSDEDYILILASIFEHLYEFKYDDILQNNFWIFAYSRTLNYFYTYKKQNLIIEENAFDILCNFAQCLPPFLQAIYGEDEEHWQKDDRQISQHVEEYLADLGLPYIKAYKVDRPK
jgi:hypothetical protein